VVSFGGVYQSQANADMKGRYRFDYSPSMQKTVNWLGSSPLTIIIAAMLGLPTHVASEDDGNMSISVVYPERAQFGIKLQPHHRIKFLVDANWTHWSTWESMKIVFDRDMPLLQLGRLMGYTGGNRTLVMNNNFKDTWNLSYGVELQPVDPITLRLGYEHRPTSVTDNSFGPVPLGDMYLYSIGLGVDQRSDAPKRKIKGLSDVLGILHQMLRPTILIFPSPI